MSDKTVIVVDGKNVTLNEDLMRFNEANLSNYIETEATHFSYFGERLADCERELLINEVKLKALEGEKFKEFKAGNSDKLCQAMVDSDPEVVIAALQIAEIKHSVKLLQRHLKAWDIAHENAVSRGHTLRKELDKLSFGIRSSNPGYNPSPFDVDDLESKLQNLSEND